MGMSFSLGAIKSKSLRCDEHRTPSTIVFSHGNIGMVSLESFTTESKLK